MLKRRPMMWFKKQKNMEKKKSGKGLERTMDWLVLEEEKSNIGSFIYVGNVTIMWLCFILTCLNYYAIIYY